MTDQIFYEELRATIRDAIASYLDTYTDEELRELATESLSTPAPPTLADMTDHGRAECQWMQADVDGFHEKLVIARIDKTDWSAVILDRNGRYDEVPAGAVTPRPDLPRLEWPGTEEDDTVGTVPESTLAVGSVWDDADALARACRESGRDQITVTDRDGDVSVWSAVAGWWETGSPDFGFEPYTIIHDGKKAHQ